MTDACGNGNWNRWYYIIIIVYLILLSTTGCNQSRNNQGSGSSNGQLQLRLVWQEEGAPSTHHRQSRSSIVDMDVCSDYLITHVQVYVKNSSGKVIAQSERRPCSDHTVTLDNIPAQSNCTVEVMGYVDDAVKWLGTQENVKIDSNNENHTEVIMIYQGETQPVSVSIFPEDSAEKLPTDTDITATFNQEMVPESINNDSFYVTTIEGDNVPGTVALEENIAVFKPEKELNTSTTYSITVTTEVLTRKGQYLAQDITAQFSTTKVWFVGTDVSASGSGENWSEAMKTINEAIVKADIGDEIWLKQGTYSPNGQIVLKKPLKLFGGFDGTETHKSERDWKTKQTLVSGSDQHRCFYISSNDVVIDGITITNGALLNVPRNNGAGGAVYIDGVSPTIQNCSFVDNSIHPDTSASFGGAVYIWVGDPTIDNCTFTNNHVYSTKADDDHDDVKSEGGAIYNHQGGPNISNCTFKANKAISNANAASSGIAVYMAKPSTKISNCLFDSNISEGENAYASALGINNSDTQISGCRFINNICDGQSKANGGAMSINSSNVKIENSIFYANKATTSSGASSGGAIKCYDGTLTIANSTFLSNAGVTGSTSEKSVGGALHIALANATITNSILWGNQAQFSTQIYEGEHATVAINYSNVDQDIGPGNQNIRINPRLCNDLHLRSDSPCINRANPETATDKDMDDEDRPKETPDIGADEFVDSNSNGMPDYWETHHKVDTAGNDKDSDQIPNLDEHQLGTDPNKADRVIPAAFGGTVREDGHHMASDQSTNTGRFNQQAHRSFFVFNISNTASIKTAALRLELENYNSNASSTPFQIRDVSVSADTLAGDTSGQTGIDIFTGLGSGELYGEFAPKPSEAGNILNIPLNQAVVDVIKAMGSGKFIIGLSLKPDVSSGSLSFGTANEIHTHQLVIVDK